jgi:hypothetical protein
MGYSPSLVDKVALQTALYGIEGDRGSDRGCHPSPRGSSISVSNKDCTAATSNAATWTILDI